MKLERLFSAVQPHQFPPELQACLKSFTQSMAEALREPSQGADEPVARNLADAYRQQPAAVISVYEALCLNSLMLRNAISSLAFQVAFILDGGELGVIDFENEKGLDAINAYKHGAHYLLFAIGYQDDPGMELSLKGVSHYLHHLYDWVPYTHSLSTQQPVSGRVSLQGFLGKPLLPLDSHHCTQLYIDRYLSSPGQSSAPLPSSESIVKDMLEAWHWHDRPIDPDDMKFILRELVYNPGLRFKSLGYSVPQILDFMTPVVDQLATHLELSLNPGEREQWGGLFRRQVIVNLLSPFAQDLASLDVHKHELMGHPGADAATVPGVFLQTLKGPLSAFSHGHCGDIYANYARMGLPLDVDMVLNGLMGTDDSAYEVLAEVGRSETTDRMLATFLEDGPRNSENFEFLKRIHACLNIDKHEAQGKVAILALNTHLTLESRDAQSGVGNWKHQYLKVSVYVAQDQNLSDRLLHKLEEWGLPDEEIIRWCGYDGQILRKLRNDPPESLKEFLLGGDLGL